MSYICSWFGPAASALSLWVVQGVLGGPTVPPLKQLWIYECRLLDGDEGLEHLSFTNNHDKDLLGLVED